jgi:SNF2 family DNA or RNA helicase
VAEYIAGEKGPLLVLHWHTEVGHALAQALRTAGRTVVTISGVTGPALRDKAVRAFQAGEVDILLGQIIAMGSAINLQANCRHVVFAERSFSPRDMRQAFARVWRLGQSEHVQVDYLDAAHPLDEATREILGRKQDGYDILTGDAAA